MARFNQKSTPMVGPHSGIESGDKVVNHAGGTGYARNSKGELFLLAVSFMGGDDTFYEKSDDRYDRLVSLVSAEDVLDSPAWMYNFVKWLRREGGMRTAPGVIALEYVKARVAKNLTDPFPVFEGEALTPRTNRDIVNISMNRGDEPAEALAYWLAKHGKPILQPIKNGIGDAARRLFNEFSFLKYGERKSAAVNMRDVLWLTHPSPRDEKQDSLFALIAGKAYAPILPAVMARKVLDTVPTGDRIAYVQTEVGKETLKKSGFTWENLSSWIPGGMNGEAWDAIIPNMGVMALVRNLRNFDEKEISPVSATEVRNRLMSPDEIAKSRMLPFQLYSASKAVESVRWLEPLEVALNNTLRNIPKLSGSTLVLVDMSGSMFQSTLSSRSTVKFSEAGALFGTALKLRNPDGVMLYQFGSNYANLVHGRYMNQGLKRFSDGPSWNGCTKEIDLRVGGSILKGMGKFHDMGGTQLHEAVAETYRDSFDRVIIITDEQGWNAPQYDQLPIGSGKKVYIWNLQGYESGVTRTGKYYRHTFGGLSDASFKMIPLLESGKSTDWPWDVK